jgi:signal transduction histidine kinase
VARAVVLFHAGGLIQVAVGLPLAWQQYPAPGKILALALALAVENAVLITLCLRLRRVPAVLISLDVVFSAAALVACAALTPPASGHTWADFMYPFTIITCLGIGAAYRRAPVVFAVTTGLAASYALSAVYLNHATWWNTAANSVAYFANTLVAWAVARELRRGGRLLDASRAQAIARTEEIARETERLRHARLLHDRVLQTLEALANGPWLTDPGLHGHVAAEAAWLRALVEGHSTPDRPGDLLTGLHELAQARAADGFTVHVNCAQLARSGSAQVPAGVTAAVLAAVSEALTNVAKHAGVRSAVLWAALSEVGLEVSVLDHGTGFDPATAARGMGLTQSIGERIHEVGGRVSVDSRPGDGTCVEITIPVAALHA